MLCATRFVRQAVFLGVFSLFGSAKSCRWAELSGTNIYSGSWSELESRSRGSKDECRRACEQRSGCNIWVMCDNNNGCDNGYGKFMQAKICSLKKASSQDAKKAADGSFKVQANNPDKSFYNWNSGVKVCDNSSGGSSGAVEYGTGKSAAPQALGGWINARATFYGDGDGMSIHAGSCKYGGLSNPYITAWHTNGGYDWGLTDKCGQCYEVLCTHGPTRGPNGQLGGNEGCHDPGRKSVIVKVTDSCPCHHPNQGNKRWCCGDRIHLDLSYVAFEAIAHRYMGVVDVKARPVDCGRQGATTMYDSKQ